jgi:aspartate ammonia-lyase
VDGSTATLTALVSVIGYDRAQELAKGAAETGQDIRTTVIGSGVMTTEAYAACITPEAVMRLGTPE